MARWLVLMGSGETTPTMVETHKRVLAAVGPDPDAVVLDTPYGFQENADEITERTRTYFAKNVEASVRALHLRAVAGAPPAHVEAAVEAAGDADWLFAGPGSPTYLLRQWQQSRLPQVLIDRLDRDGAMVFASAAVCTLGTHTLPVYEIYKVGQTPFWEDGLGLLPALGLDCVAIPHFDNAEGGTHDTRFCYLGAGRLEFLEGHLPDDVWVLGIDEHTALLIDLETRTAHVEGRGGVTIRRRDGEHVVPSGDTMTLDDVIAFATGAAPHPAEPSAVSADPSDADDDLAAVAPTGSVLLDEVATHERAFEAALADGDAITAADHVLAIEELLGAWAADTQQSDEMDRARGVLRTLIVRLARLADQGLHDHRELVARPVEALLDLRREARSARDFERADQIRDVLVDAGVEVRDTPDGAEWEFDEQAVRDD